MDLQVVELVTFLWGHLLLVVVLASMAAAALFWLASVAGCGVALARRLHMPGRAALANDTRALERGLA